MANESPLFATRFEYDPAGNLTQRSDSQYGADIYRYDPLGRITEHLDPQSRVTRYLNDPAGDRLKTRIVESARQRVMDESVVEGEWSREGEYEGTYYRFDRAGNLVERRDEQRDLCLVWDANQRLIESYANDLVTRYGYDPLGRRLFKEIGDRRALFYWDGDVLVGEAVIVLNQPKESILPTIEGNVITIAERRKEAQAATQHKAREYVYYPDTFEPLALIEGGESAQRIYYYHNDPNGCPTRLTDASGEVRWAANYTAWGKISKVHIKGIDNPIRLQGQYEDEETELHYNRHRYYEPHAAMFISPDPWRLQAGTNLFTFAANSLNWLDPLGLRCGRVALDANAIVALIEGGRFDRRAILRAIGNRRPIVPRTALREFVQGGGDRQALLRFLNRTGGEVVQDANNSLTRRMLQRGLLENDARIVATARRQGTELLTRDADILRRAPGIAREF